MDIAVIPDVYAPDIDERGDYIDHIPFIYNGIYCPCGTRKDKIYDTKQKFASHIKTKRHTGWLKTLNLNKTNHLIDSIKQREIIETQKKIISTLQVTITEHKVTNEYLLSQLTKRHIQMNDSIYDLD